MVHKGIFVLLVSLVWYECLLMSKSTTADEFPISVIVVKITQKSLVAPWKLEITKITQN